MLEYVNRTNSDCYKWDSECAEGCLPLWIADMDFAAAKPIREAMQRRLDHGVFGYYIWFSNVLLSTAKHLFTIVKAH